MQIKYMNWKHKPVTETARREAYSAANHTKIASQHLPVKNKTNRPNRLCLASYSVLLSYNAAGQAVKFS